MTPIWVSLSRTLPIVDVEQDASIASAASDLEGSSIRTRAAAEVVARLE